MRNTSIDMRDNMIIGNTATEVVKKTIEFVLKNGTKRKIFGGTIPKNISDPKSPNDFYRGMVEMDYPITVVLTNPLKNWSDYSRQSTFISLREQEDHYQHYNPGHVIKYSKLYNRWLVDGYFNYTYGERLCAYPYNINEISGIHKGRTSDFNQIERVIKLLRKNPTSRKICISVWFPTVDLGNNYCPCNAFFQLRIIDNKLSWTTVVRSLDVLRGFTENIFMFTHWMQYIASRLGVELGSYKSSVLNAHIYKDQIDTGYHKQNMPDPYDYYKPQHAFDKPFPSDEMKDIDELLFKDYDGKDSRKIQFLCESLPEYWKNWKLALVADWYRQRHLIPIVMSIIPQITNEFAFPVARYTKKFNPDVIDLLPWDKQREYLKEHD